MVSCSYGGEIHRVVFTPPQGMTRAEVVYLEPPEYPKGFLVLCPGYNGDGTYLILKSEWQKFADDNKLILVGLSFASDIEKLHDGTGYYYPEYGSGETLIKTLKKIHKEELPIYIWIFRRCTFHVKICGMGATKGECICGLFSRLVDTAVQTTGRYASRHNSMWIKR